MPSRLLLNCAAGPTGSGVPAAAAAVAAAHRPGLPQPVWPHQRVQRHIERVGGKLASGWDAGDGGASRGCSLGARNACPTDLSTYGVRRTTAAQADRPAEGPSRAASQLTLAVVNRWVPCKARPATDATIVIIGDCGWQRRRDRREAVSGSAGAGPAGPALLTAVSCNDTATSAALADQRAAPRSPAAPCRRSQARTHACSLTPPSQPVGSRGRQPWRTRMH